MHLFQAKSHFDRTCAKWRHWWRIEEQVACAKPEVVIAAEATKATVIKAIVVRSFVMAVPLQSQVEADSIGCNRDQSRGAPNGGGLLLVAGVKESAMSAIHPQGSATGCLPDATGQWEIELQKKQQFQGGAARGARPPRGRQLLEITRYLQKALQRVFVWDGALTGYGVRILPIVDELGDLPLEPDAAHL